jgi:lipoprotein-anchoring transpeptidase ErfK/SrfK
MPAEAPGLDTPEEFGPIPPIAMRPDLIRPQFHLAPGAEEIVPDEFPPIKPVELRPDLIRPEMPIQLPKVSDTPEEFAIEPINIGTDLIHPDTPLIIPRKIVEDPELPEGEVILPDLVVPKTSLDEAAEPGWARKIEISERNLKKQTHEQIIANTRIVIDVKTNKGWVEVGGIKTAAFDVATADTSKGYFTSVGNFKVDKKYEDIYGIQGFDHLPPTPGFTIDAKRAPGHKLAFHGSFGGDIRSKGGRLSHGCIRCMEETINNLYNIVKIGTPVTILGFDTPKEASLGKTEYTTRDVLVESKSRSVARTPAVPRSGFPRRASK